MTKDKLAIGIDIGGTTIKTGIVSPNGTLHYHCAAPTPEHGAKHMAGVIASGLAALPEEFRSIRQLGVGVPGAMDVDRRIVNYPPNLKCWGAEPFFEYLSNALEGFQIELDNDAKTAALAESRIGKAQGLQNFLLATLGTGVGGGLFLNGKIFRGDFGGAGEFGHLSIDWKGRKCASGGTGCIEAYLGSSYLVAAALRMLKESQQSGGDSALIEYLQKPTELTPLILSKAANDGDRIPLAIFAEAGTALGFAFASVAKLLDVRTFILAGGIAEAFGLITKSALPVLQQEVLKNQRDTVQILHSALGANAGIIGAAMLCFDPEDK